MSLKSMFRQADKIITGLNASDFKELSLICNEIRKAEDSVLSSAETLFIHCYQGCEGLCCRNIVIDAVISVWDFIFILASDPDMKSALPNYLSKEVLFFSSNCAFLKDGVGPCILPANLRPEVCMVTFCQDETPIKKEIRQLKAGFRKLAWFITFRKFKMFRKLWWA